PLVHLAAIRQRAGCEMTISPTIILGLESSCDDSAVALVTSDREILAQAVVGQNAAHQPYGGVVPEIAARAHVEILPGLIRQLLEVRGVGDYRRLATTIDDAAGEAFDKAAKLLGLAYPGGPAIEELAKSGNASAVPLPRPLVGSSEPHFSFAGLKSAVQRAAASGVYAREDIGASFQQAVIDCLVDRTRAALAKTDAPALVVAGGVAANQSI